LLYAPAILRLRHRALQDWLPRIALEFRLDPLFGLPSLLRNIIAIAIGESFPQRDEILEARHVQGGGG
jgi:hypothetical protein